MAEGDGGCAIPLCLWLLASHLLRGLAALRRLPAHGLLRSLLRRLANSLASLRSFLGRSLLHLLSHFHFLINKCGLGLDGSCLTLRIWFSPNLVCKILL